VKGEIAEGRSQIEELKSLMAGIEGPFDFTSSI